MDYVQNETVKTEGDEKVKMILCWCALKKRKMNEISNAVNRGTAAPLPKQSFQEIPIISLISQFLTCTENIKHLKGCNISRCL